ncbi:MAG: TolC family protein, partial [Planctomycetota bacterium]
PPVRTEADEIEGLIPAARLRALRMVARDEAALAKLLETPLGLQDLTALAWLRSPEVKAARERLEAARTGYSQASDLKDLVSLYRSFLVDTRTRVGPEKSRRATASVAPYPNIDALSGEMVRIDVDVAFERLRGTVRDLVADAERAHADAARLTAARRILEADVRLQESLVAVMRSRLEAGDAGQAGFLAFQARLQAVRTELEILEREQPAVRARWNRLLSRKEDAPLNPEVSPAGPDPMATPLDDAALVRLSLAELPEYRIAALRADRASVGVRLAETMTLPRMDLGASRFEQERLGTFPDPGRIASPRSDFGVREAQITEMRARERAMQSERDGMRDRVAAGVAAALFELRASGRRWLVHEQEIVPLAERAFRAIRGAYEGNRTGYIELLDRARSLLDARLGRADARRAHAHARARLLESVGVRFPEGG